MRQGLKNCSDMGHRLFLNSTWDIGDNKRQGYATLPFLKIDMQHLGPPIKGPNKTTTTTTSNRKNAGTH